MRLNVKALACSFALMWGGGVMLLVGLGNMFFDGYGQSLLDLIASIYPGYEATGTYGQLLIGMGYGVLDGFIGGAVLAWVYNLFAPRRA